MKRARWRGWLAVIYAALGRQPLLTLPLEEQRSRPPWWSLVWRRRWWIVLSTLLILVSWLVPPLLYRHTGTAKDAKLRAITDTRTALLAGLIGVGALLTFWLNSRVYRITARTLEVTEQGHITERYSKAIEQLGDDRLTIRLGGIYALERIARDSQRDHPTVVEVLSAFVREETKKQATPRMEQGATQESPKTATSAPKRDASLDLATDIQAAVTVLGRLPELTGISRGDLTGAHLLRAALRGANLRETNLGRVTLREADLRGADLRGGGPAGDEPGGGAPEGGVDG